MSCPSETDVSRWSEALAPPCGEAGGEAVYAGWDCPQVAALYAYTAAQPDELPLTEGDIVNVTRKTSEGETGPPSDSPWDKSTLSNRSSYHDSLQCGTNVEKLDVLLSVQRDRDVWHWHIKNWTFVTLNISNKK